MKKSHSDFRLLLETKDDYLEVERLLDLVFTPKRRLLSSYQLRSSTNKVNNLCYLFKDKKNNIVASIRFWDIKIDSDRSRGLLLGPLAVHPIYQSEGLGEKLVLNSLEQAFADNWNWIVLVGDINYYSKYGFSNDPTNGISIGDGLDNKRLLGLDIKETFLDSACGNLIRYR